MSKILKCDRCGAIYEKHGKIRNMVNQFTGEREYANGICIIDSSYNSDCDLSVVRDYDLCTDCLAKIIGFIENSEKSETVYDTINIMLDEGAKEPDRAHEDDAGMDLFARETKVIPARGSATFDTGVHIEIPKGYYGSLESKSGLNVNNSIISGGGVIDCGYTGSIVAKLYNMSDTDYTVNAGDKITQIVILHILTPTVKIVDSLSATERGDGGFGSTGK